MNTTRTTRTALRTAIAATVLTGAVAVPTAAFASDGSGGAAPSAAGTSPSTGRTVDIGGGMEAEIKDGKAYLKETGTGKVFATLAKGESYTDGIHVHFDGRNVTARTQGDDKKQHDKKDGKAKESSRTVKLDDGKYAVVTELADGSYKAVVTGPDGFVFGTLTAAAPSTTLDGGLKVTLDQKTGKITQTTVESRNGEAARELSTGDKAAAVNGKKTPKGGVAAGEAPAPTSDTDPALIGGALAAAAALGGAGVLVARRRRGTEG
ncbi:hypothetical protein [Streptomyces netropsis]|uniref:Gram-positive cocci surface proteins LPxTG domain-containing protein n=1 Tax=Streptomyces netropsis TaxID=55404 RepID=A0A7W7LAK7_STRNE|nr:hypothetical protein [Streptomyces netropsis]MBB4886703.1 hypothetical protein [Streptomyces netropsis]GGR22526.1 hypothetical protein GCM10010219_28940 [Streptomyces netropsis]